MDRRNFLKAATVTAAVAIIPAPLWAAGSSTLAAWRAQRRTVSSRFGAIACTDQGRGDPAIFLHGFPLSGFQWRGAVAMLAPHYRCIVPDFLGLGDTEAAAEQDLGAPSQAEMIVALLDTLGVARAHVVASDSGGAVAQLLAARRPERVRSLLLTNCDSERESPPAAMREVIALSKRGHYARDWLDPWLANGDCARAPDQLGGMCYADPAHPTDEAIRAYLGPVLATPERRRQVEAHAIAQERNALAGIGPALRRLGAPARIVWGEADTIFARESAAALAGSFGNSKGVRHLPSAKLFWPEEHPEIIAEEADVLWRRA